MQKAMKKRSTLGEISVLYARRFGRIEMQKPEKGKDFYVETSCCLLSFSAFLGRATMLSCSGMTERKKKTGRHFSS